MFQSCYWSDKRFTINLVQEGIADIISGTATDVHPPLYYLIVKLVLSITRSEIAYRVASFIGYIVLLLFAYFVIARDFGKPASVLFTSFVSFMYWARVYIIESRMYMWAAVFVVGCYAI